jgi:hypothetical protein
VNISLIAIHPRGISATQAVDAIADFSGWGGFI